MKSALKTTRQETSRTNLLVVRWSLASVYRENLKAYLNGFRRALNEGGTASSKTWSILQLLILIAQNTKEQLLISVVSESLPHLKRGCIRDVFRILDVSPDSCPYYNKTEQRLTFGHGGIEFFGADESDKVRGPRRDILFLNEANNIPWETARGLDVRTNKFTFADWNPTSSFWAHEYWIGQPENQYIHSTYRDALEVIPKEVIDNILATGKRDPNWANIYLEGKLGKIEGLVYPFFEQVDSFDGDVFYGLDFGFSNDPTALVRCLIRDDCLYSEELIFETGLTNQDIANRMLSLGIKKRYDEIFADAAEPKSIEEIYRYGFNIKPASKGQGSVEYGHQLIRQYKHFWTKGSVKAIEEQRNFRYIEDKNGKLTEKTTHNYSHLMDARRYACVGKLAPVEQEGILVYDAMKEFHLDRI